MRASKVLVTTLILGVCMTQASPAPAQGQGISDADCQALRLRLAEHARLSDAVRRAVAAQAGPAPAAPAVVTPSPAPAAGRGDIIKARLGQIPKERQTLEDQRLAAMVKFELSRAGQIQGQIEALDVEKLALERELAALPSTPAPAAPTATVPQPTAPDVQRIRCQDMPAAVDNAVKIRRRELGAREDQTGAIPLIALKGQTPDEIGKELAGQLSAAPGAATQLGLLDADGDGRLDGFVDVPVPGVFRLFRLRADGAIGVDIFPAPGSAAPLAYGEATRRLDETAARQAGQTLPEMVATRQASPARGGMQTADFSQTYAQIQAGNFAEAARLSAATARITEFQNLRGQTVRVIEVVGPVTGGVSLRRLVVLAQPNDQELWEETTTIIKTASSSRTDVEVTRSRATRSASGAPVGAPSVSGSSKFSLER